MSLRLRRGFRLEGEEVQNEEMRAELAEMKRKIVEAEAAQAVRDKEHQVLLNRTHETEENMTHLLALFGAKVCDVCVNLLVSLDLMA